MLGLTRGTPRSGSGGLSVEETARALNVSVGTIGREQRLAEAWLHRELALRVFAAPPGSTRTPARQLRRPAGSVRQLDRRSALGVWQALGADFDARTREAWRLVLTAVAAVMQEGAATPE
jgi:ECF sigma factor